MSSTANATGGTSARTTTYDTEARPGIMTTEFWVGAVSSIAVVVAGYVSDAFSVERGWELGAYIAIAYLISRGLAKLGSKDALPVPTGTDK